ncbi:formylglycine-generating enzyme family protein [Treponema putidum]|uniref:formylglycine-generating enzyme family protein n=1 Tax=Treponema putidum TaxID=221027 RepID=UPI002102CAD8|nr:formylglycine-generating enzyme family protein [Treponema putidum]UTY31891.1 formylglycine-generating enzyme family protein [Treponema putidum]
MKKFNSNKKAKAFTVKRAAVLITAAILAVGLLFTGCPNSAGGSGGGGTPPTLPADKTYTVNGISFTMKDIAAVTNGTVGHTDNASNNAPHTVSLTAYRIGETEVTQELWEKVMGTNPSNFEGSSNPPESGEVQEKRPVENVNWYQCIAFCNELTKKVPELGESQCVYTYNGNTYNSTDAGAQRVPAINMSKKGFRLPTEAEWEWAAKGGKNYRWAGTDTKSELKNYAWYKNDDGGDANGKTHQVKLKSANGYGLYDMSGNVWEWCWDWYSSTTPTGGQDPAGGASGTNRVERGGSWSGSADRCTVGFRVGDSPDYRHNNLGFRLACRP